MLVLFATASVHEYHDKFTGVSSTKFFHIIAVPMHQDVLLIKVIHLKKHKENSKVLKGNSRSGYNI